MAWMRFRKRDIPGGLWVKCPSCEETLYQKDLGENFKVCAKCQYHFPLSVQERVQFTLDEGTFEEVDAAMSPVDALQFIDRNPYPEKIHKTQQKTGRKEAMVFGVGRLRGREVVFGALEFGFLGGSMGVVVGEKVSRAAELATQRKLPLVMVSASGGARMHEGALSLMQMAKSCAALGRLHDAGGLYISLLAHPTTGGVTASWATMADIVLAEPKALIGFAGPRVIQSTIRQELPKDFQTAEFLLKKGQLDRIVQRSELVDVLESIFDFCLGPLQHSLKPPKKEKAEEKAASPKDSSSKAESKAEDKARKKSKKDKSGDRPSAKDTKKKSAKKSDKNAKARAAGAGRGSRSGRR